MKRLLFFVTLLFIFSIIPFNVKAEKVGPVIKGFQLGQTLDELKVTAGKMGLILEPLTGINATFCNYAAISKDNVDKKHLLSGGAPGVIALVYFYIDEDNTVIRIHFTDKALTELFNATGRRTGFLQALVDNYDEIERLERVQEYNKVIGKKIISYQYTSDQEGWTIRIDNAFGLKEASSIDLTAIEKTRAFEF